MAIDFPVAPFVGYQYAAAGLLWTWDGTKWTATGNNISIPDAPTDGQLYGRKSASWAPVSGGGGGIADAPIDGTAYARKSGNWAHLTHFDIVDWLTAAPPPVVVNSLPPSSPSVGALWFDAVGLEMYIWYNDGITSQWIPASPL